MMPKMLALSIPGILAQQSLTAKCLEDCSRLGKDSDLKLLLEYNNPLSNESPFPYINRLNLTIFSTEDSSQTGIQTANQSFVWGWKRGDLNKTITLKVNGSVGIMANYNELNYDQTRGGIGNVFLGYFGGVSGNGPIVIGSSSASEVGYMMGLIYLVLF